jgi:tripartite-type tricarboxylate transporter receptor subunit TctC
MNRDGASGAIGLTAVATARPDGHVLGFTPSAPLTVLPHLQRGLSYSLAAFRPICQVAAGPLVLAALADSPIRTLADAIAAARAAPGRVAVGYGGTGTLLHLALSDLESQGRVEFLHVPFRGDPPNVLALQSREITLSVLNLGSAAAQRLRMLAVFSPARHPDHPDVPTAREQGLDVVQEPVLGLVVAAGAPAPAIARLEAACRTANADPRVAATLRATAQRPAPDTGEAYAALLARSAESAGTTLRRLGIAAP